jgi:hypothetical protein
MEFAYQYIILKFENLLQDHRHTNNFKTNKPLIINKSCNQFIATTCLLPNLQFITKYTLQRSNDETTTNKEEQLMGANTQ